MWLLLYLCCTWIIGSTAKAKAFYDRYGEEGLKHGVPDGEGGLMGGFYTFDRDPLAVFEEFFGTQNPFTALMDLSAEFKNLSTVPAVPKGPAKVIKLGITLEEACFGAEKQIEHTRKIVEDAVADAGPGDKTRSQTTVHEQHRRLTLHVRPGTRHRQRYVFEQEGNARTGVQPGELVVVVEHLPHPRFSASNCDIVHKPKLSLSQALAGCTLPVELLDGRVLQLPIDEVAQPGKTKVVEGEGMPDSNGTRGNLVVEYDVEFPRTLTEQQRKLIRAAFAFPSKPTNEQKQAFDTFTRAYEHHTRGWARNATPE